MCAEVLKSREEASGTTEQDLDTRLSIETTVFITTGENEFALLRNGPCGHYHGHDERTSS